MVLATLPAAQAGAGNALNRALQRIAVCLAPAVLGSVLNSAYRGSLRGSVGALPGASRRAALASVAGAHAVAVHLPAAWLVAAAGHAYRNGMVQVTAISAIVLIVCVPLVLAFLPRSHPAASAPAAPAERSAARASTELSTRRSGA